MIDKNKQARPIDDRKVQALIVKIQTGSNRERCAAAKALGRLGDPRAVPVLVQVSKDKSLDYSVQFQASNALGNIRNPQATPALVETQNDEGIDVFTRRNIIEALGAIGDPQAASALIRGLKDEDTEMRIKAAIALGTWKSKEAVPALIMALKDNNSAVTRYMANDNGPPTPMLTQWVCNEAAIALGEIGDPRAVPALSEVWRNKRYGMDGIRTGGCAIRALGAIGGPLAVQSLIGALDNAIHVKQAVKALKITEPAVPKFLEALSREKTRALVLPALIEIVRSDEYMSPRRHAAELLKLVAEHQPDPALRTALPILRSNYWRTRDSVFKEAMKQIEAATATSRNLPLPAAALLPDASVLPRPAAATNVPSDALATPQGWWLRLRRRLTGS